MGNMESAPLQNTENVEVLVDWKELKELAPAEAKKMLSEIAGYDDMTVSEKVDVIEGLVADLSSRENYNEYRFIAKYLAGEIAYLEETDIYEMKMSQLGR